MKKRLLSLILALVLIFSITTPIGAASDTGGYSLLLGGAESKICTATFKNPNSGGRLLLSLSSVPDASIVIMDKMDFFCKVASIFGMDSEWGCNYVDIGGKFYKYVNTTLRVDVSLYDASTGRFVWKGMMKDGDIIWLGNDHPSGYIIKCKPHSISLPFVKLVVLDNLEVSK